MEPAMTSRTAALGDRARSATRGSGSRLLTLALRKETLTPPDLELELAAGVLCSGSALGIAVIHVLVGERKQGGHELRPRPRPREKTATSYTVWVRKARILPNRLHASRFDSNFASTRQRFLGFGGWGCRPLGSSLSTCNPSERIQNKSSRTGSPGLFGSSLGKSLDCQPGARISFAPTSVLPSFLISLAICTSAETPRCHWTARFPVLRPIRACAHVDHPRWR